MRATVVMCVCAGLNLITLATVDKLSGWDWLQKRP
jgi:hypothetical protein